MSWKNCASQSQTIKCGERASIALLCPNTAVSITPIVACTNNCALTLSWTVKASDGTIVASNTTIPASFIPTSAGIYSVVMNAVCGNVKCDPCNFTIIIEKIMAQTITTTFTAGVSDNFSTQNGVESPVPSQALLSWIIANYGAGQSQYQGSRNFDDDSIDRYFAHTFTNLAAPSCYKIQSIKLKMKVKNGDDNDAVGLGFITGGNTTWSWSEFFDPTYSPSLNLNIPVGSSREFTLDLSALPKTTGGPLNLINDVITNGSLDVYVQDDSEVDYLELEITYVLNGC